MHVSLHFFMLSICLSSNYCVKVNAAKQLFGSNILKILHVHFVVFVYNVSLCSAVKFPSAYKKCILKCFGMKMT